MLPRRSLLAAAIAAGSGLSAFPAAARPLGVGDPAPPFTVTTFDKQKISSDDLRGKVVVLNFWATWCGPCRNELPMLDAYYRRHKDQGLRMYAVATEDSVPEHFLKPLAAALSFPLVHKMQGKQYVLVKNELPTNYVIDRSGVIRRAEAGAFDYAGLQTLLTPLLAEPVPAGMPAASAT